MQFSHALIALVAAGLANAQLPDVPSCSLNCFVSALTSDGCSSLTDFACHCQKTQLVSDITPCVEKACDTADQVSVSNIVVSQCSSAGHPISLPPIATTTDSGSTTTSSAPAQTSATATETSSSGSETTSASSSGSSSGSSSSSSTGSAPTGSTTPSSGGSGSGSSVPSSSKASSTPLGSKTGSGTGATSTSTYNAGTNVKGNMAGVAAIAAAAAYIL